MAQPGERRTSHGFYADFKNGPAAKTSLDPPSPAAYDSLCLPTPDKERLDYSCEDGWAALFLGISSVKGKCTPPQGNQFNAL